MSTGVDHHETEIKLRAPNAEAAAELLTTHGFQVSVPRVFERNVVFDTAEARLRSSGMLLRVRDVPGKATLTFKGVAIPGRHKVREELEVAVSDAHQIQVVFERLGFRPGFVYEKYRTEFTCEDPRGSATLDETPIGTFLELEGEAEWIDFIAARLGFEHGDYVTSSYGTLFAEYRRARDLPLEGDMVFEGAD